MSYIHMINRAIDYVEDNLFATLSTESIAKQAGLSKWYFQKIFHGTTGETLKDYILTRQLSMSAHALRNTDDKIVEIAFAHGFDSHEVFTRAFKRMFQISPSAFRKLRPEECVIPPKPRISSAYLSHLYRGMTMQPTFVKIEKITAAGLTTTFSSQTAMKVIPDLWKEFRENMSKITGLVDAQRIAIIGTIEGVSPNARLEYLAGAVWEDCDDLPEGFSIRTVPAGEYAEFLHTGPVSNFAHTINYIYGSWLPKSGRQRADGPEFALYGENFNPLAHDAKVKVFIPLQH